MNLKIRHYLLTGLLVWLPMGVTVWLLTWLVGTMDGIFLAILGALDAVIPGMHELVAAAVVQGHHSHPRSQQHLLKR